MRPSSIIGSSRPTSRWAAARLLSTTLLVVFACLAAGAFELSRAIGGNSLSWAYVFEWPLFAGMAIFLCWRIWTGHSQLSGQGGSALGQDEQDKLAAWNRYLAELNSDAEQGHRGSGR